MGAHEWCFYGWKLGAAHRFFGPKNATDLWSVKKVNPQAMQHLTEKPVELAEQPEHPFTLFNLGAILQEQGRRAGWHVSPKKRGPRPASSRKSTIPGHP